MSFPTVEVTSTIGDFRLCEFNMYMHAKTHGQYIFSRITGYGSTLIIVIAMVFVFSSYIREFTFCFQFQVNLTFGDFTAQNMSKAISVSNISLNYHVLAK